MTDFVKDNMKIASTINRQEYDNIRYMNSRIIEFRELLWWTKYEKLSCIMIKGKEVRKHPVGYVLAMFSRSDVMREI